MINAPDFARNPGLDILVADDIDQAREYGRHAPSFNTDTLAWIDGNVPIVAARAEELYRDLSDPRDMEAADASYAGIMLGIQVVRGLIECDAISLQRVVANTVSHLAEADSLVPLSLEEYLQLTLNATVAASMRRIAHDRVRALCYSTLVACLTRRRIYSYSGVR